MVLDFVKEARKNEMENKFNALDYWGKLAIKLNGENAKLKEQIVNWAIMLDSPDFKDTDAGLVKEEMIKLLKLELEDKRE